MCRIWAVEQHTSVLWKYYDIKLYNGIPKTQKLGYLLIDLIKADIRANLDGLIR